MQANWWINKLKDGYQSQGTKELLRLIWQALTHIGKSRLILFALSEPKPLEKAKEAAKNHVFRFATEDDMRALSKTPDYMIKEIDIDRVKTGAIKCLLQLDGNELAGYACIWGNQLPFIAEGIHINLPDDTIYNFKSYTNPQYRGDGFQALRHLELLRQLEGQGVKRLFGFVHHLNGKSLHGVRKSGYKPVGELIIRHRKNTSTAIINLTKEFWCDTARI